jgi:hypothetical protein
VPPELYPILLKLLSYLAFGRWWTHAYNPKKYLRSAIWIYGF